MILSFGVPVFNEMVVKSIIRSIFSSFAKGVNGIYDSPTSSPFCSSLKIADIDLNFKLVNDPEIDGKSIYELTWSTYGIDPTLSRHRAVVPVSLKFKNYKALSFSLQCKFYPEEDTKHITWGKVLNSIGVQCVIRRGSNFSSADNVVLS